MGKNKTIDYSWQTCTFHSPNLLEFKTEIVNGYAVIHGAQFTPIHSLHWICHPCKLVLCMCRSSQTS
jgi:hypothetical protein